MSGSPDDALRYAYRLLSYRGRSKKEIKERLERKGFDNADETIRRLEQLGLIDDRARAEALKKAASESKHLGRASAVQYLRQMGIERQMAEEALRDYDEIKAAEGLIRKKARILGKAGGQVSLRKLSDALRRRGFSSDTIRKVISAQKLLGGEE